MKKKILVLILIVISMKIYAQEEFSPFDEYFVEYRELENPNYAEAIIFKEYIVFTKLYRDAIVGFVVYPYSPNISIEQYSQKYGPVYDTNDSDAAWLIGISGEKLFIDYGTPPGLRGIEVYSLSLKRSLYKGTYLSRQLRFLTFDEFVVQKESTFKELEEFNIEQYNKIISIKDFEEKKEWIGVYRDFIVNIKDLTETITNDFKFAQLW